TAGKLADEPLGRRATGSTPAAVEDSERSRDALGGVGIEREDGLSGRHRITRSPVDPHPGARLDGLALTLPARTEPPRRQPHGHCVDVTHCAALCSDDTLGVRTE